MMPNTPQLPIRGLLACGYIALLLFPIAAEENGGARPDNAHEFAVASEGYLSNRDSFESFSCRFTDTKAKARSIQDALNGNFIDPITAQVSWIVSKKSVRYEVASDPDLLDAALARPRSGNTFSVPFDFHTILTDGVIDMAYSPVIKGANVWPPGVEGSGPSITPFGLGIMGANDVMNPGRVLRECANGEVSGSYDGSKLVDGDELLMFSRGAGDYVRLMYLIDPKKGFNPIEATGMAPQSKQLAYRAFFSYRECQGERWFPVRGIVVSFPERSDPPFEVREIKVTQLSLEEPAASDFFVDLPDGTQVSDPTSKGGYYYVKDHERIKLTDLKNVHDHCLARLSKSTAQGPGSQSIGWIYVANIVGLVVICALALWFYRQRRKPRASP